MPPPPSPPRLQDIAALVYEDPVGCHRLAVSGIGRPPHPFLRLIEVAAFSEQTCLPHGSDIPIGGGLPGATEIIPR